MLLSVFLDRIFPLVLIDIVNQYYSIDFYDYDDGNVLYAHFINNRMCVQYNRIYESLINQMMRVVIKVCNCGEELCDVYCYMCRKNINNTSTVHLTLDDDIVCNNIKCFLEYCKYAEINIVSSFDYMQLLNTRKQLPFIYKLWQYHIDPPLELQKALITKEKAIWESKALLAYVTKYDDDYKTQTTEMPFAIFKRSPIEEKYYPYNNKLTMEQYITDYNLHALWQDMLTGALIIYDNSNEYVRIQLCEDKYKKNKNDSIDFCPKIISNNYNWITTKNTIVITRYENDIMVNITRNKKPYMEITFTLD